MSDYLKTQENRLLASAKYIIRRLEERGYEAYIVGGCVRDSILGTEPHDYDICTSALPHEVMGAFDKSIVIPTGLKHGTVTVVIDGNNYEVTTFRIDGQYSDNRHPDNVEFTRSLIEDLKRRDFTMNAIAYSDRTGLIDPFDGIEDIRHGIIRCVGNPDERFSEDALRILRAIRFAAQLNFMIEPDMTEKSIHKMSHLLENVAAERINSEFCKIAVSGHFAESVRRFCDVFEIFIPELRNLADFNQNSPYHEFDVLEHTLHAVGKCPSDELTTRLAVFFHDFGKPQCYQEDESGTGHFYGHGKVSAELSSTIMRWLKFDNQTRRDVKKLVFYHDVQLAAVKKQIRRWLNRIGEQQFRRLLDVKVSDIRGQKENNDNDERLLVIPDILSLTDEILRERECFQMKDLSVNGKDLLAMGFVQGKEVGDALRKLLDMVIDGQIKNDRDELLNYLQTIKTN
ncbi:MAG: HD domain-containing protein [Oscillospiraceae bacterium]|nr:HD domain-containing protein [Oscillospiraceae bacterium]